MFTSNLCPLVPRKERHKIPLAIFFIPIFIKNQTIHLPPKDLGLAWPKISLNSTTSSLQTHGRKCQWNAELLATEVSFHPRILKATEPRLSHCQVFICYKLCKLIYPKISQSNRLMQYPIQFSFIQISVSQDTCILNLILNSKSIF